MKVNKGSSSTLLKTPILNLNKKQVMAPPFNFALKLPHCDECLQQIVNSPTLREEFDDEELFVKCLRCEKKIHKSHKQCIDSKTSFCKTCSIAFFEFKAKHFKKPKTKAPESCSLVDSKLQRFFNVKKGGPDKIELKGDQSLYTKPTKRVNPHKAALQTIDEDSDGEWGFS